MIKLKLHLLMAEKRMTQKSLAEQTGLYSTIIHKYYNDTILHIPKKHLDIFCNFFNCQIQDLIEFIPDEEEEKNVKI